MIKHYEPIWPSPSEYKSYVEPFFGAGAIYGWVKNQNIKLPATVGDINGEIIGLLREVANNNSGFTQSVTERFKTFMTLQNSKDIRKKHYYELRKEYWDSNGEDVALLYTLMKLGFNGIWQTCKDSKGLYGTPAGLLNQTRMDQLVNPELLKSWGEALKSTSMQHTGYESLQFEPNDALIYLDPPYRDSFTTYGTGFGDKEQLELVEWALKQKDNGATVLLANRCVDGDNFFESALPDATFHYFNVTYTAGRRKRVDDGFEAKQAREFLAVIK